MKKITLLITFLFFSATLLAQENFLNCIQNSPDKSKATALFFYRPDCPYCEGMKTSIEKDVAFQTLIKQNYNVNLVNIQSIQGKEIAALYKISAVPAILICASNSYDIKQLKGFGSINRLSTFLNLNYKSAGQNHVTQGMSVCGDGIVQNPEQCDDGNMNNGDGCSNTCQTESGYTCTGQSNCIPIVVCGNGIINAGEQCDDGNQVNGDGCSATCIIEVLRATVCGNGDVTAPEQCDDGNLVNGDGCDDTCTIENNWVCTIGPSVCNPDLGTANPSSQFTNLTVFPNPFSKNITTSFYLLHNSIVTFSIIDITGKIVYQTQKQEVNFGQNEINLNIDTTIATGSYILQIKVSNQEGNSVQYKKLLKQ